MKDHWLENTSGRCPTALIATRKRVAVELRNGMRDGIVPVSNESPAGWLAWSERPGMACNWSLTGHPFDIKRYWIHE